MIKVYIASPYSTGDPDYNTGRQIDCSNELMNLGFNVFAPLLFHFQHLVHERPYEDWLKIDMDWLLACDCVLRLYGESPGADREVALAREHGIPVFFDVKSLKEAYLK